MLHALEIATIGGLDLERHGKNLLSSASVRLGYWKVECSGKDCPPSQVRGLLRGAGLLSNEVSPHLSPSTRNGGLPDTSTF
jgi:hypothetical protein